MPRLGNPEMLRRAAAGLMAACAACLALAGAPAAAQTSPEAQAQESQTSPEAQGGKALAWASEIFRGDTVGALNASIHQASTASEEVEEPHEVPVVSGNAELDAYLDLILENVIGRDENALRGAYEWLGSYSTFSYFDMDYISPDVPWREWSVPCALQMVRMEGGNCYRYAALMCWIARALGYDARIAMGEVRVSSGWAAHGWVEVNVDGEPLIIDAQQHARPIHEGLDFFMVSYDEAPLYYSAMG